MANGTEKKLAEAHEARRLDLARAREADQASASNEPKENPTHKEESKVPTQQKDTRGMTALERLKSENCMGGVDGEEGRRVKPKVAEGQ